MIYGHPVIAATRALRFANHVTTKTEALGENASEVFVWDTSPKSVDREGLGMQFVCVILYYF